MRDIRQEPDAPIGILTYPERMLMLDLGRAHCLYCFGDRWGAARSERTHDVRFLDRLVSQGLAKHCGDHPPAAKLTPEGIWFFRTLERRALHGLSQSRTSRIVAQESRSEGAAEVSASIVGA